MKNKSKNGKIIFLIIVVLAVLSLVFGVFSKKSKSNDAFSMKSNGSEFYDSDSEESGSGFEDDFDGETGTDDFKKFQKILNFVVGNEKSTANEKIKSKSYVAAMYISGVISKENRTYNQKWLLKQIKKVQGDPRNSGILLVIDSPGGTVYESDEAYLALEEYKNVTKRPVYAYFCSLSASGGYYIGCAADKIFANRNTLTGSIGVIAGQSVDATEFLSKLGIKMTTITAGKNKNMGNYDSVLTEEQRSIFQAIADEAYGQFTEIVAESRGMKIDDVKKLADGRIYTALQAKNNGLIDEICSFNNAKERIKGDFDGKTDFVDFKYVYEESFFDLFSAAASFVKNPEAGILSGRGLQGRALYIYQ